MYTIFFTSDLHFNHEKIIEYCNRPFTTVEEMNEALIENWNKDIGKNDVVYMLGDFCFGTQKDCQIMVNRLKGNKHFIIGNHDKHKFAGINGIASVSHYKEIAAGSKKIVLSHYPIRSWNGMHRGSLMLHGHCHGTLEPIKNSIDVGVDCNNYRPFSLHQVLQKIEDMS